MHLRRANQAFRVVSGTALVIGAGSGCGFQSPAASIIDAQPNSYECACSCATSPRATTSAPARSADDAEEALATGSVLVTGQTIDMTVDSGVNQIIGLRFPSLGIPRDATILSARVQFTTAVATSGPSNLTLQGQAADDAALFTATTGNISGRPRTAASVPWSPPAWNLVGEAGAGQLTPELATVIQEIVSRPGWSAGNALALLVTGSGTRAAASFDNNPARVAKLQITFREPDVEVPLQTCMPAGLNPNLGAAAPSAEDLAADCATRVENTLRGLTAACGYPSLCNCELSPAQTRFVDKCDAPCAEVPLTAGCANFDPKAGNVTATNAPGDTPVCTTGSPLAASVFGRRSTCDVSGDVTIDLPDEDTKHPAANGFLEIEGDPCPGQSCAVGLQYRLDLASVTYSHTFGSATFHDLAAVGETLPGEVAVLDPGGAGTLAPDSTAISAQGRRGSDRRGVVGQNGDDLHLTVDWTPGAASCSLQGAVAGTTADPELSRCEDAGPSANAICTSDDDCEDVDECTDQVCNCLPVAANVDVALSLAIEGQIVNQPPSASAGVDQTVECNRSGGADLTLDGAASRDPDGDIASFRWFLGSRAGAVVGFEPRSAVTQAVGSGVSYVLRVIDTHAQADEDTTAVEVVDTTPPVIACNSPATIVPPGPGVTFTATASDVCDASVTPALSAPRCFKINGSGAIVPLPPSSCNTTVSGDRVTIATSGGVGTHIVWTASATDDAGNPTTRDCEVVVVKP